MTSRQLNIRLNPRARDQLDALAFVRRTSASALARDVLLEYLGRYANEPGVEDALTALAAHDAADQSRQNVRRLDLAWSDRLKR